MISVIIPAYNAARTIKKCLASILLQTFRDFEVIVVDDGSTDGTKKIAEDFFSKCKIQNVECRIVAQENRGAPAARNRGAKEAKGEYLIFCDADIVLRPDCLLKMVRTLEAHPEASYAYSSFKFGWKKFTLWPFDVERLRRMPYIHTTSLIRYSAIEQIMSSSTRYTYPRSRISVTGGDHDILLGPFDVSIKRLQDWDLWLTMLEQGHTGVWVPEVLFRVINTKGTMSQWMPSFVYKIPKWLGIQPKAVMRYNEAVAAIKEKHNLP